MRNRNIVKRSSVDLLVSALCLDFPRREKAIREGGVSRRTLIEFRYLNFKIMEAVGEVVTATEAMTYIKEIGENIGYAKTKFTELSEVAYKTRKKSIRDNIARKLHLLD